MLTPKKREIFESIQIEIFVFSTIYVNAKNSSCLLSKSLFRLKKLYLSSFNHCGWSDLGSNPQKGHYLSKNRVKLVWYLFENQVAGVMIQIVFSCYTKHGYIAKLYIFKQAND